MTEKIEEMEKEIAALKAELKEATNKKLRSELRKMITAFTNNLVAEKIALSGFGGVTQEQMRRIVQEEFQFLQRDFQAGTDAIRTELHAIQADIRTLNQAFSIALRGMMDPWGEQTENRVRDLELARLSLGDVPYAIKMFENS